MCIDIRKLDGSLGRARLASDWEPGRSHDLDVHEGQYCDKLDAYFLWPTGFTPLPKRMLKFKLETK